MCMCLVLFVVSEIPESSRLLSCFFLYEIRIEYNYLVRIKYYSNNYKYIYDISLPNLRITMVGVISVIYDK